MKPENTAPAERIHDGLVSLWHMAHPPSEQAKWVYAQSVQAVPFLGLALFLSYSGSLHLALEHGHFKQASSILLQSALSTGLLLLPLTKRLFSLSLQKASRLFGLLMLGIAILEMEAQLHSPVPGQNAWISAFALMGIFALFHAGSPLQFLTIWGLAFAYFGIRFHELDIDRRPSHGLLPIFLLWPAINAWWFRVRLQYAETGERLKAANARLKGIDRFRSDFFAGISHEFRTPLTLILSPLQTYIDSTDNEEMRLYLQNVRRNGNRLLTLVNNLIDLARLDAGRMNLHLEAVDLCELVRGILAIFQQAFRSRGLSLRSEIPLQLLTRLDVEKTETILMNLIGNALKFTETGGVTVRLQQQWNTILLTIEDTGPGIPREQYSSLFERFGASSAANTGSGLGLALCRELARFMNGDLRLRSTGPEGSVFELSLPLRPVLFREKQTARITSSVSLPEESSPAPPAVYREDSPVVLIVEDDVDLRHYLQSVVGEHYSAIAVADGEEALAMAREHRPDVTITDMAMSPMDGFELLQRFREDKDLRNIPFLFLTSSAGLEDRLEGLRADGDAYLIKPFNQLELIEKISVLLRSKQRQEEGLRSERESLVGDLHDIVGSDLTDLLIVLDSISPDSPPGNRVQRARQLARSVLGTLRDRIHEREDMQLIRENFMHGVKVILNRRYTSVGRGVRFRFHSDEERLFVSHLGLSQRHVLYSVFLEITTNDLKYGTGISTWKLSYRNGMFRATFLAQSVQETTGRLSFVKRLKDAGGACSEKNSRGRYAFHLRMDLRDRGHSIRPGLTAEKVYD